MDKIGSIYRRSIGEHYTTACTSATTVPPLTVHFAFILAHTRTASSFDLHNRTPLRREHPCDKVLPRVVEQGATLRHVRLRSTPQHDVSLRGIGAQATAAVLNQLQRRLVPLGGARELPGHVNRLARDASVRHAVAIQLFVEEAAVGDGVRDPLRRQHPLPCQHRRNRLHRPRLVCVDDAVRARVVELVHARLHHLPLQLRHAARHLTLRGGVAEAGQRRHDARAAPGALGRDRGGCVGSALGRGRRSVTVGEGTLCCLPLDLLAFGTGLDVAVAFLQRFLFRFQALGPHLQFTHRRSGRSLSLLQHLNLQQKCSFVLFDSRYLFVGYG
eukprot:Rhum_TRINITY_DN11056_c0_g1::Rhum_TRINITY_DN11056_c0_g1_i1::g.42122::m.42122